MSDLLLSSIEQLYHQIWHLLNISLGPSKRSMSFAVIVPIWPNVRKKIKRRPEGKHNWNWPFTWPRATQYALEVCPLDASKTWIPFSRKWSWTYSRALASKKCTKRNTREEDRNGQDQNHLRPPHYLHEAWASRMRCSARDVGKLKRRKMGFENTWTGELCATSISESACKEEGRACAEACLTLVSCTGKSCLLYFATLLFTKDIQ